MRTLYRLALYLLPSELRRRHGASMESLFARALSQARVRGSLHAALTGVAGLWDVVRRAMYEQLRPQHDGVWSAHSGDPRALLPTTRSVLRRHVVLFGWAFVSCTAVLLLLHAQSAVPRLNAQGASMSDVTRALLLAVPFTAALSIPMAVFLTVLSEFTRMRTNGTLAAARQTPDGVRRLIVPVALATVGVAALAFVVTAAVVPRTNAQLSAAQTSAVAAPNARAINERSMTIAELREAARQVKASAEPAALTRAAAYQVEVHKKFALPAACVVLALAGMAIAFVAPRASNGLVIVASVSVLIVYYFLLVTGEDLADRLVVSPFVGMWGANALVLTTALLAIWRRGLTTWPSKHIARE